jgi:hypothetical protein
MKLIQLTSGEFAQVDDEDFEYLNQFRWYCSIEKTNKYALRRLPISEGGRLVRMHRVILGLRNSKELCDHKDHNGLNNQKSNLRRATPQQNLRNRRKNNSNTTSKYKGVYMVCAKSNYRDKKYEYKYWKSTITINNKEINLGLYPFNDTGERMAAQAYDNAVRNYYAEFANPNVQNA